MQAQHFADEPALGLGDEFVLPIDPPIAAQGDPRQGLLPGIEQEVFLDLEHIAVEVELPSLIDVAPCSWRSPRSLHQDPFLPPRPCKRPVRAVWRCRGSRTRRGKRSCRRSLRHNTSSCSPRRTHPAHRRNGLSASQSSRASRRDGWAFRPLAHRPRRDIRYLAERKRPLPWNGLQGTIREAGESPRPLS